MIAHNNLFYNVCVRDRYELFFYCTFFIFSKFKLFHLKNRLYSEGGYFMLEEQKLKDIMDLYTEKLLRISYYYTKNVQAAEDIDLYLYILKIHTKI